MSAYIYFLTIPSVCPNILFLLIYFTINPIILKIAEYARNFHAYIPIVEYTVQTCMPTPLHGTDMHAYTPSR